MIRNFCSSIIQNKNVLMLFTVAIYILALYACLQNILIQISFLFTLFVLFLIIKNIFPLRYILVWTVVFYLGVINTSTRLKDVDELLSIAPVNATIQGKIISIPQGITEGKPKFFFNVEKISFGSVNKKLDNEKVLVTLNTAAKNTEDLKLYDSYLLSGRLATPFKAGNPSQFDYGNYLRNNNAYAVFYAKECERQDVTKTKVQKFLQNINDYREYVISLHSKYINSPYLEILGGIVFGDDAVSPDKSIKQSFVNSGLLHILAASGMNVAFIYSFFVLIMSLFRFNFKVKTMIGMAMVVIYALMTGLGASIIRATIMLLFVMAGKLIDRDAHSISLLSFVAFLMLLYNPLYISDVGFQLSFIVTFGLLVMSPIFFRSKHKIINWFIGTLTVPVIAQLWVIPVQIFYFNSVSLYSIFANIMSVPIVAVLSFGGFVSALLSIITPLADFVCKIFDLILVPCLVLLVKISDFFGTLPYSTLQTTHPAVFQIVLYYLLLLVVTAMFVEEIREKYLKAIKISVFVIISLLCLSIIPIRNSNLEITVFDVGNADCFLIKTPENKHIMIDSGKAGYNGGKSQAEIIVLKYFKDRGIKTLESIVVSHFDNDHCGGVVDIVKNLKVKKIYVNDLEHPTAKPIFDAAKANNTEIVLVKNNQDVYFQDALSIKNYVPITREDDNENSIITLLKYKEFSMLFTGDSDVVGIKSILENIPEKITVLKVPHHGAKNGLDKEILSKLEPEYSVISVGENKFGHPSPYILYLLDSTKLLRTDIHNSIKFVLKNNKTEIYNYDSDKKKYLSIQK